MDREEFLKKGGMGDCLIALERQRVVGDGGSEGEISDVVLTMQTVRVPIPEGRKAGSKLKVRTPGNSDVVAVYIPKEEEWSSVSSGNGGKVFYFDVEIPILPEWTSFHTYVVKKEYEGLAIGMKAVPYPVPAEGVMPNGRRKALLIGINYTDTKAALAGSSNDVRNMKELLLKHGFKDEPTTMVTLMEEGNGDKPTKANIQKGIDWLTHNVVPGDVLFFHYTGHGAQIEDKMGLEADGLNESILPIDYLTSGEIVDDELWARLVYKLPNGVRLTAVMDCCHSGTGLDLPFTFDLPSYQWIEDENPAHSQGHVVLFSCCEDSDDSLDILTKYSTGGAMTHAFLSCYDGELSFTKFIDTLQFDLQGRGFSQIPQLSSTQKLNYIAVFNITDGVIIGNRNGEIGRGEVGSHARVPRSGRGVMNDLLYSMHHSSDEGDEI